MSPTHLRTQPVPLKLDLTAALFFERGLGRAELLQFAPQLERARQIVLESERDAGPRALLEQYKQRRRTSPLGQILGRAKRLRDGVDRVVVLAGSQPLMVSRALLAACCHPYHNELSRGERGGRPQIYFAPPGADNDQLSGLLDILPSSWSVDDPEQRWAVVTIGDSASTAIAAQVLHEALEAACGDELDADEWNIRFPRETETLGSGVLLAASAMGMDVVQLLRGAATMAEQFRSAPVGDNPVLDLAGLFHLLSSRRGIAGRQFDAASAALRPLANWYLGTAGGRGETDENVLLQLTAADTRRDPLRVTMPGERPAALPELAARQADDRRRERAAAGQPTVVIRLAALDEFSTGQLIELFPLSRQIEQKLLSLAIDH